jgi:hypothetical protein
VQNKNGPITTFALNPFLFFSFLSKCEALDHLLIIIIHHTTWHQAYQFMSTHLAQ